MLSGTISGMRRFATGRRYWLVVIAAMLVAAPAHAFRCGNKLVTEGMREADVIALCGEPVSRRNLGYVLRNYVDTTPGGLQRGIVVYGYLTEEVLVTELVYNLGPRRLMRRLVFEGGWLAEIEQLGYGFRD